MTGRVGVRKVEKRKKSDLNKIGLNDGYREEELKDRRNLKKLMIG